ncbi:aryl-alcohol dehydrogenase-like predicted oxidoreductase [Pedobacter africanus]|uniref:Aryl-alcohol dehydrogenase-like predicted oxidoreductase n=1 Tax=Pedobacter africanus TaxID=151894 RepID=A0ACC6L3Q8_9SPHI|nr:aldo/keto reductase [Pedobacter africanus]MDR6786131.1 aryl-alcohol dehydrogenase-like predicted oxidoreductase [Pedobacter africanus]
MENLFKVILGTVQLGLPYGVNNFKGVPTVDESIEILSTAHDLGIRVLDTAEAYGFAQKVIGDYHKHNPQRKFEVITKYSSSANDKNDLIYNILNDLKELSVNSLSGYMFHNFSDYKKNQSKIASLASLKKEGLVKKIGVSTYTNEEIYDLLDDSDIDFVQLPFNLFDNNNLRLSALKQLKLSGKEVHVRSVFLQGLFYKDINDLSEKLSGLKKELVRLNEIANVACTSISSLALGYALENDFIDHVLIGVDDKDQLLANVNHINESKIIPERIFNLINEINIIDKDLLNPSNW